MDRIATLRAWLADKPGDRFATYAHALELERSGDRTEAEALLRRLVAEHPASGAGHFRLGQLLAAAGRDDEALAAWRAGLEALAGRDEPDARRSVAEITRAIASHGDRDDI
jgi:predicted Zn-dependent protease